MYSMYAQVWHCCCWEEGMRACMQSCHLPQCHALPFQMHVTQNHHFADCETCLSWHTQCRKEETRNVEGVPLLKRGSRGKGAAIPIQAITAGAARSARQGQSLRLQIVALQILGLKQVHLHNWSLGIRTYQCALCNIMVSLVHPALLLRLRRNRAAPACFGIKLWHS